uniref:Glutamate receptor-interacting protein 1 n=1 Tax=Angiostrongylus cantonensis TaxID=6313 RepID=A0A158PCJ9_ANGCA
MLPQELQLPETGQTKNVAFASDVPEAPSLCRLKRINTPHFKGVRGALLTSPERDRSTVVSPVNRDGVSRKICIVRDGNGHLGLSIAGGLGSTPFVEGDCSLFVSRVTPDGPASIAGLRVNDKLLRQCAKNVVNNVDVSCASHDEAVRAMNEPGDVVELLILRKEDKFPEQFVDVSHLSDSSDVPINSRETLSVTLKRDASGSPGFAVASSPCGASDGLFISYITPNGPAVLLNARQLKVGDRVVSINGTRLKGVRHDQAVALLTGNPYEDVYITVMVVLMKDGKSLGLSIVGGCDHSSHPFGVDRPGVFISKITTNSPADRCQRLRIGDRILEVNDRDIRKAQHIEAVEVALKQSGPRVVLLVTHEPQPPGMRIITVTRKDGQSLGILIHGGVGKPAANPADERDEGIFVEKIEPSSVCHQAGLQVGHRLIEVNGDSLLGCDQSEAAAILRSSNELRILVCDGYNLANVPRTDDRDTASSRSSSNMMLADENKLTSTTSVASAVINNPKSVRIPPAVAPKPTLRNSQLQNVPFIPEITQPEKLTFASKLPAIGEDGSVPPSERILSNDISIERSTVVDAVTGERKVIVVEKSVTKREASF